MTREIRERQIANNMTEENRQQEGWRTTTRGYGKERRGRRERKGGEGGAQAGRQHRVERRARRRKLGQQQRAHFLFILLFSEWPSLVAASSEPDSLPFFGRAAGTDTARRKEKVEGRG